VHQTTTMILTPITYRHTSLGKTFNTFDFISHKLTWSLWHGHWRRSHGKLGICPPIFPSLFDV